MRRSLLFLGVLSALVPAAAGQTPGREVWVRAQRYFNGERYEGPATLRLSGSVIAAIDRGGFQEAPEGVRVIAVPDAHVIPHLVLAGSSSLLRVAPSPEGIEPSIHAADAFDPFADHSRTVAEGLAFVYLSPGASRLVPGIGGVANLLAKPAAKVMANRVALHAVVTRSAYNPPDIYDPPMDPGPDNPSPPLRKQQPATRADAFAALRELLAGGEAVRRGETPLPPPGRGVPDLRPVLDVLDGRLPFRVRAHAAVDILAVLDLVRPFPDIRLIIEGASEAEQVISELSASGATVVLSSGVAPGAALPPPEPFASEEGPYDPRLAGVLQRAGIVVVLAPPEGARPEDLLWYAAQSLSPDFRPEDVLRSVTSRAAQVLGLDLPVAIQEKGAANLLVYAGDPLAPSARPLVVLAEGEVVYDGRAARRPLAITARELHTASDAGTIANGTVVVVDGKIAAVGTDVVIPWNARRLAVDVLTPGFIDCMGQAGIRGYRDLGDGALAMGGGLQPQPMEIAPSSLFDPEFPDVRAAALAGVTAIGVAPRPGRPVVGQLSIVKTLGSKEDEYLIRKMGGVVLDYQNPPPGETTRGALAKFMKDGKDYHDAWRKYADEKAEYEKKHPPATGDATVGQTVKPAPRRRSFSDFEGAWEGRVYGGVVPPGGIAVRVTIAAIDSGGYELTVADLPGDAEPAKIVMERRRRTLSGSFERLGVVVEVELTVWREEAHGTWRSPMQQGGILLARTGREHEPPARGEEEAAELPGKPEPAEAGAKAPEPPKPPRLIGSREPMREIVTGGHPLFVSVRDGSSAEELIRLLRVDYDARTVFTSPELVPGVLDVLDEHSVALLVTPASMRREKGEWVNPAALAVGRGIPVVLGSGAAGDSRTLYQGASYLVRFGFGRTEALKALTAWGAFVLNVSDRIGTIEVGKDADFALIEGRLFEPGSRVVGSVVNGHLAGDFKKEAP